VSDEATSVPLVTGLIGNYPNPFNPETVIQFVVGSNISFASLVDSTPRQQSCHPSISGEYVRIDIFNIKGQKVRTPVDDLFAPGTYSFVWDDRDDLDREVGSGIYFYRMQTEYFSQTRKMILIK
jgi:flagellar hook assembly protein FlgD